MEALRGENGGEAAVWDDGRWFAHAHETRQLTSFVQSSQANLLGEIALLWNVVGRLEAQVADLNHQLRRGGGPSGA